MGSAEGLVFLPDLIEARLTGAPFLVEVLDAAAAEFELCVSVNDEIGGGELAVFSAFNTLSKTEVVHYPGEGSTT